MTSTPQPAIDVHGLVKRYGSRTVVDAVDLTLMPGRICGFLGPNGSGKTTTLRLICGLLTPDAGTGTCWGYDLRTEHRAIKRQTGYMTQKFWPLRGPDDRREPRLRRADLSARQGAGSGSMTRSSGSAWRTRQDQLTGALSGGWKQRLALAACVLHEPKLLLLDEPTAGVDPKARRAFWDEIHALAATGITVLVSTHYMDEAERCHEIAYIAYGKLMARGTADEVIAGFRPQGVDRGRSGRRPSGAAAARCAGSNGSRRVRCDAARLRPGRAAARGCHCAVACRGGYRLAGGRADARGRVHPPDEHGPRQRSGSVRRLHPWNSARDCSR